jgi:hypothetical protein
VVLGADELATVADSPSQAILSVVALGVTMQARRLAFSNSVDDVVLGGNVLLTVADAPLQTTVFEVLVFEASMGSRTIPDSSTWEHVVLCRNVAAAMANSPRKAAVEVQVLAAGMAARRFCVKPISLRTVLSTWAFCRLALLLPAFSRGA